MQNAISKKVGLQLGHIVYLGFKTQFLNWDFKEREETWVYFNEKYFYSQKSAIQQKHVNENKYS